MSEASALGRIALLASNGDATDALTELLTASLVMMLFAARHVPRERKIELFDAMAENQRAAFMDLIDKEFTSAKT